MRPVTSLAAAAGIAAALFLVACNRGGPSRTVTKAIELDGAESAAVELKLGAGELHVAGGSPRLLDATFKLNLPSDPVVTYRRDGARGTLTVEQQSTSASFSNVDNTWDLRLNDGVPIALRADIGAGETTMKIGSLNLQSVDVSEGAGELTLDLRGAPKRSYDVHVNAVPKSVGIVATASAGVGGVSVDGLQKQGNSWVNAGHEQDAVVIHLDVKGGVGEIHISAE